MANLIVMAERPVSDPETDPSMRRRTALSFALASPLLLAAGCSTGPADGQGGSTGASGEVEDGALPVTLEHAFGSTTVQSAPQRVVTIGWSDQDVVAALGLVPAAAAKITWGGNAKGSTDWFDEQIRKNSSTNNSSGSAVERYDDSDGVPLDEIATFEPDLILGVNSGMTKAEYAKLSKIAATVAFLASGFCAVGYWMVHAPNGPYPIANGGETIALYCFVFLYFAAAGAGPWSIDAMRRK